MLEIPATVFDIKNRFGNLKIELCSVDAFEKIFFRQKRNKAVMIVVWLRLWEGRHIH